MANCIRCGRQLPPLTFGKKICQWCVQHEAAQRGEEGDDAIQPVMAAPWVKREASITLTRVLFGANLAVFLAMVFRTSNPLAYINPLQEFSGQFTVDWGANWGPRTLSGEPWRLFSYMFLHGSLMHIAFNMWCLWDLGALCESLYGRWTFAVVYILTGIAGGAASVAWSPDVPSVGASGAIFGLAGALIASFYLGEFSLPKAAVSGMLRSVVVFVGYNLFFGAVIARTDNAAHIGGLVMGLLLGALIAKAAPAHDAIFQRIAVLLIGAVLVAGGVLWLARSRSYLVHQQSGLARLSAGDPDAAIRELQKSARQK